MFVKGNNFFVGPNTRKAVAEGRADFVPVFLSEIPLLFRRGILPLDVALISLSPPDRHGYCSLGLSVDITRSAVECARMVVAQVNTHMPRTFGDTLIHLCDLDFVVEHAEALPQHEVSQISDEEKKIGKFFALPCILLVLPCKSNINGGQLMNFNCRMDVQASISPTWFPMGLLFNWALGMFQTPRCECVSFTILQSLYFHP
jgi:hypothetical protein